MILLGNLALWLAFLIGLWGAITGFVGGVQGRADLQHSARHASFAPFGALLVAGISLLLALFPPHLTPPHGARGFLVLRPASLRGHPPRPRFLPPRLQPRVRRGLQEPQPADVLSV